MKLSILSVLLASPLALSAAISPEARSQLDAEHDIVQAIKRVSTRFDNVADLNARTLESLHESRDFNDFVDGAKDFGNKVDNLFSGNKRDAIDDAQNTANDVKNGWEGFKSFFTGGKRDVFDDAGNTANKVEDGWEGFKNFFTGGKREEDA